MRGRGCARRRLGDAQRLQEGDSETQVVRGGDSETHRDSETRRRRSCEEETGETPRRRLGDAGLVRRRLGSWNVGGDSEIQRLGFRERGLTTYVHYYFYVITYTRHTEVFNRV